MSTLSASSAPNGYHILRIIIIDHVSVELLPSVSCESYSAKMESKHIFGAFTPHVYDTNSCYIFTMMKNVKDFLNYEAIALSTV